MQYGWLFELIFPKFDTKGGKKEESRPVAGGLSSWGQTVRVVSGSLGCMSLLAHLDG